MNNVPRGTFCFNVEQKPESAAKVERPCKCGHPPRPGQRDCRTCHAAAEKRHRTKKKMGVERERRALHHLTVLNPETQEAFNRKFRSKAVVICGREGAPDITGLVIGFLPNQMLKVLDDDGHSHIVSLDTAQEDLGRTDYGRIYHQTELHTQDPS